MAWFTILAAMLGVGLATGAAAEPVPVRAGVHDGYGRIVFAWPGPVGYQARIAEGRLEIGFERPIEANTAPVLRTLARYLTAARPGEGGRSFEFALRGTYELRHFVQGSSVVIDLVDPPGDAGTAPPAQTAADAGSEAPAVAVRVGEHDTYSRLVFDWPSRVSYRVAQEGTTATVTFDRSARLDLGAVRAQRLKHVTEARARPSATGVAVDLILPGPAQLRHFLSGSKVVLDVIPTRAGTAAASAAPVAGAPAPMAAAASSGPAAVKPPPSPPPAATTGSAAPTPAAASAAPVAGAPAPIAAAAVKPPPSPPPAATTGSAAPAPAAAPAARLSATPQPAAAERKVPAAAAAPAPGRPTPLTPPPAADAGRAPGAEAGAQPAAGAAPGRVTAAPIAGTANAISLRFDWNEPVGAAIFRRAGWLWVVFDGVAPIDVKALAAAGGNLIRAIEPVPAERATVMRIDTVAGVNPSLRRDGLTWFLDFGQQSLRAPTPITTQGQDAQGGSRLFVPVPEPGQPVAINDPDVGDTLVAVPVIPLGHGIDQLRDYPQFLLLPTAQGVVIQPRIDDLRVRPIRQGIELTSAGGLQISPVTAQVQAQAQIDIMRPLTRVFELDEWRRGTLADFTTNKERLQQAIVPAKDEAREKARMNLARYYFAFGFAAESLGVLQRVADDRPAVEDEPEFRALRGADHYLMGHYADAAAELAHPSLEGNDEATFWRAVVVAAQGNLARAAPALGRNEGIVRPYPTALRIPLQLLVASAAIATGDIRRASRQLDVMALDQPTPAQAAQLAYVQGQLAELAGRFDDAVAKWEQAQDGPHRPTRAKAARSRVDLLLKLRKMTPADAIEELEKLRFAWRGDDFEFDLLRRLGALYLAEGDYRNGLRTLRQAATNFRTHDKAPEVTQEMTAAFARLYLGGEADRLPPVSAIALYDEFKELTPAGQKGDEMIRRLADRLAAVDLLDRSAELLEAQIQFRLSGLEKGRVGARLALLQILNRKPDKAVAALKASEAPGLPADLVGQRRHLMARALAELGRAPEALVLLEQDESLDAELLRVEFHWENRQWPDAAQALRRVLKDLGARPNAPFGEAEARHVLDLAIALTLGGNDRAVVRLRQDYGPAMDATSFKDAFRLIATSPATGLVDYRTVAGRVGDAEKFTGFMAAYRERLKSQGLSRLN